MTDLPTDDENAAVDRLARKLSRDMHGVPLEVVITALADVVSMSFAHLDDEHFDRTLALFTQNVRDLMPINREMLASKLARMKGQPS